MSASDRGGESGYGRWLEIFVPGRICLMGEHSDWAGSYRRFNRDIVPGMCLVSGTNQGMYARVRPHPHKLIVSSVDHFGNKYGPTELLMDPEVLLKAAAAGDSYFSYIYGVAYQIAVRYNCRGLVIENLLLVRLFYCTLCLSGIIPVVNVCRLDRPFCASTNVSAPIFCSR